MCVDELIKSLGIYACEKHYEQTIEALLEEKTSYVNDKAILLFELKEYISNFEAKNTTKVVTLLNEIKKYFLNILDEKINNVIFYAKVLV